MKQRARDLDGVQRLAKRRLGREIAAEGVPIAAVGKGMCFGQSQCQGGSRDIDGRCQAVHIGAMTDRAGGLGQIEFREITAQLQNSVIENQPG